MGTRAIVRFIENGMEFACVYRQFDGYPEGLGTDIARALADRVLVNGFNDKDHQCNGMGCLAAMVVAKLKEGCGNVYLHAPGTAEVGEDYVYTLSQGAAIPGAWLIHLKVERPGGPVLFDGPLAEFTPEKCDAAEV